jgi:hypothetical protein
MADILRLPHDLLLVASVGRVAIAGAKLEYILRLTIKTIAGLALSKARADTKGKTFGPLRAKLQKIAKTHIADEDARTKLDEILTRAGDAVERRNRLIHDISYYTKQGKFLLKEDNNPARLYPTKTEINTIANDLLKIAKELNGARKSGFIFEALTKVEVG